MPHFTLPSSTSSFGYSLLNRGALCPSPNVVVVGTLSSFPIVLSFITASFAFSFERIP